MEHLRIWPNERLQEPGPGPERKPLRLLQLRRRQRCKPTTPPPPIHPRGGNAPTRLGDLASADRPVHLPIHIPPLLAFNAEIPTPLCPPLRSLRSSASAKPLTRSPLLNLHNSLQSRRRRNTRLQPTAGYRTCFYRWCIAYQLQSCHDSLDDDDLSPPAGDGGRAD